MSRPRSENPANVQGWYRLTGEQMTKLEKKAAGEGRKTANYVAWVLSKLIDPPKEGA